MITIHISRSNKGVLEGISRALKSNRESRPDGHHIVITPDNAALYVEFKIMNELGLFGAFDIEVASFMRLAKKYLNLSGVLTDEGAMMVLKKALTENADGLKCFKSASKSYGFLKESYEVIKNIRNSRVDIEKIDGFKGAQKLKYKLGDAAFLYKSYIKELQEGYGDNLSYLEKLYLQIDKLPHLSSAHIYIMLYDGFSSLELDIIEKLFANSVSVDVGILGNDSAPNAAVFGEGGVKESLIARAAGYKYSIKIHDPKQGEVFKRINDGMFSYAKCKKTGSEGRIRLVEAKSPYEEVTFAAREINAAVGKIGKIGEFGKVGAVGMVGESGKSGGVGKVGAVGVVGESGKSGGVGKVGAAGMVGESDKSGEAGEVGAPMSYGDIAVLTADPFKYSAHIKTVFKRFGIPFSAGAKNKLAFSASARFIAAAGELSKRNFSVETFLEFIKNPYSDITERDGEEFENFCVERGIEYLTSPLSGGENAESAERVRAAVLDAVSPFRERSGSLTAGEFSELAAEFFRLNGVAEKTEEYAAKESDAEDVYFRIQSYKKIVSILNESKRVFGSRKFTLSEIFDIFLSEVAAAEIAPLQQKLNVFTGGLSDKAFDKKILFILGADYGALPAERKISRIISDRELQILKDEGIVFDDGEAAMKARAVELLSSPSERLYVCRTVGGRQSAVFSQLFGMFDDLRITSPYGRFADWRDGRFGNALNEKASENFGITLNKDASGNFEITKPNEIITDKDFENTLNKDASKDFGIAKPNRITTDKDFENTLNEKTSENFGITLNKDVSGNFEITKSNGITTDKDFENTPNEKTSENFGITLNEKTSGNFKSEIQDDGFTLERELDEFIYFASNDENLSAAVLRGLPKLDEKNRDIYAAAYSLLDEKNKKRAAAKIAELDAENGADFPDRMIDDADKLFFRGGIFRVTQAENYYRCPYLHFLKYGIRLKERGEGELEARDAGNITHGVLEKFIIGAKNMDETDAAVFAERITDGVMNGETFAAKLSPLKNIGVRRRLKKDILRICADLHRFILNSDFKPAFAEAVIARGGDFSPAELKNGLCLNGKIDRIDLMDKNAVVIDYKTGSVSGNVLSDAYYGNNLQLFSYLAALQKNGYKAAAALYLKIKDDFLNEKDAEFRYRTTGVVIDDIDIIKSLDNDMKNRTGKSRILPIEIKEIETTEKADENGEFGNTEKTDKNGEFGNTEKRTENGERNAERTEFGNIKNLTAKEEFKNTERTDKNGEFGNTEKQTENREQNILKTKKVPTAVGSALSAEEFRKAVLLGTLMSERAAEEIMSGYIAKKPVKTKGAEACAFCEYKAFCGNDKRVRIQRTAKKEEIFKALDTDLIKDERK